MNTVFKPSQRMTFQTAPADYKRLEQYCLNKQHSSLIIDLSEVTQCDSAGLALLIAAKRLGQKVNKACRIVSIPATIQALGQFCGVERLLE